MSILVIIIYCSLKGFPGFMHTFTQTHTQQSGCVFVCVAELKSIAKLLHSTHRTCQTRSLALFLYAWEEISGEALVHKCVNGFLMHFRNQTQYNVISCIFLCLTQLSFLRWSNPSSVQEVSDWDCHTSNAVYMRKYH